jgi:hypothetical protein
MKLVLQSLACCSLCFMIIREKERRSKEVKEKKRRSEEEKK